MLTSTPTQLVVHSDYDLIVLRQAVRQAARVSGFPPSQQARITAAVSEVARALLIGIGGSEFRIAQGEVLTHDCLDICCALGALSAHEISQIPSLIEAKALVDEAYVEDHSPQPQLILRMWLARR